MKTTRRLLAGTGALIATAAMTILTPLAAQAADPAANGTVVLNGDFAGTAAPLKAPYAGKVTASASNGVKLTGSAQSMLAELTAQANCMPAVSAIGRIVDCGTFTETLTFDTPVTEPILKLISFGWGVKNADGLEVRGWAEPRIAQIDGKPASAVAPLAAASGTGAGWKDNTLTTDGAGLVGAPGNAGTMADVQLPGAVTSVTFVHDLKAVKTAGPVNSTATSPQSSAVSIGLSREITPVTATISAKDDDAKTATLTGKGEPGATITVSTPNGPKTATVAADGTWSVDLDGLAEGKNDLTVSQPVKDQNGTTVTSTADVAVTIDVPAPAEPLTAQVDSKDDDARTAVISGTGTPGATVTVTTPTGPADTTVQEDGTWSLEVSGLAEGQNDLTVTSGDESADVSVIIAVQEVPVLLGLAGAGVLGATGAVIGRRKRARK